MGWGWEQYDVYPRMKEREQRSTVRNEPGAVGRDQTIVTLVNQVKGKSNNKSLKWFKQEQDTIRFEF